ncbi:YbcC family protein [Tellurirhabdus rosea]|uniref:YbcC family protein n=1 Tax=Tellurirhabdus rosea TaxID=2674997 RepID=UPI002257464C|nr:DUF2309 domain-containing protein [Tellurirhabdus rosea]
MIQEHHKTAQTAKKTAFDEHEVLHALKHYLPSQAPLKDFVHHNTLHAFQHLKFHEGLRTASTIFGYSVYLSLNEFRERYRAGTISPAILDKIIIEKKGKARLQHWKTKLLDTEFAPAPEARIGRLRGLWKKAYKVNPDKEVHALLFRLIGSYLDQGISIWKFPATGKGFLGSIRDLERNSFVSLFRTRRARTLLLETACHLPDLLALLVGDPQRYSQYLFDQQFAHPGWSGMVAVLEDNPQTLLDRRKVSLRDFIALELLMEIDALDRRNGENWLPLAQCVLPESIDILAPVQEQEVFEVYALWQEAFEWTYYDQVLRGLQLGRKSPAAPATPSFQALFCIDDRECSFRRYVEQFDPECRTFGTPGFFGTEFYFQPEHGKFYTKVCPAPVTPGYLIRESEADLRHRKDAHFARHPHGLLSGWALSQTMGFWSAIKLAISIFKPTETPAMVSSFRHMDRKGKLAIEATQTAEKIDDLQLGFTVEEMANRLEGLLKSIGLVDNFAPLVYIVGHGASSVNNTHYAGYDCGACSGRSGSVNARVAAFMGNHPGVREVLKGRGLFIPESTRFVGALHDTTRDEMEYYDEETLPDGHKKRHGQHMATFEKALSDNAKERSRRFLLIDTKEEADKIHEQVKLRALSLFEPRPEWNHATNALCIVGRRESNQHLFLDRRSFLNSYDYRVDPEGRYLLGILRAAAPVCGGINLEYYFSRVDNYRLGAGTKLPHNVMGLIGVANGMDGDLRPGLPRQMINIHDPVRLMLIVEHFPEVVLKTIQEQAATYEWFIHEWVHLAVVHPETKDIYHFRDGSFRQIHPLTTELPKIDAVESLIESTEENLPVFLVA